MSTYWIKSFWISHLENKIAKLKHKIECLENRICEANLDFYESRNSSGQAPLLSIFSSKSRKLERRLEKVRLKLQLVNMSYNRALGLNPWDTPETEEDEKIIPIGKN